MLCNKGRGLSNQLPTVCTPGYSELGKIYHNSEVVTLMKPSNSRKAGDFPWCIFCTPRVADAPSYQTW